MRMLRCVLRCFKVVTGLHMNFGKSVIVRVGNMPDIVATNLGCKVGNLPIPYLGLLLSASFKCKEAWGPENEEKIGGMEGSVSVQRG